MNEIRTISLHLLDLAESDLRYDLDDRALDELCDDIRDNGLYYPLIVQAKGERWEVVDGGRRLRCLRRLGIIEAPCMERTASATPNEAVQLKTNLLRENNSDAEIAAWLGELATKHDYGIEQLCKLVGRSEAWVNARIDLLRGDADVLNALGRREINLSQAQVLNSCKDKSWRDLGLHYAVVDKIAATRLKDWLIRNTFVPAAVVADTPIVAPAEQAAGQVTAGIVCDWCGGFKDPVNMVSLWLHRWEWDMVQQILSQGRAQQEAK